MKFIYLFIRILVNTQMKIIPANKYYFSADDHEQKNKKTTSQIKFLAVTIKQQIKLVLQHLINSLKACNFVKKETLEQVFSCEFCEISKSTFLIEHLVAASMYWFKCYHCTVSSTVFPIQLKNTQEYIITSFNKESKVYQPFLFVK